MLSILKVLVDAQFALHLLQAEALGFWIDEEHDKELQHHHGGEEIKGNGGMVQRDHGKNAGEDGIDIQLAEVPRLCPLARTRVGKTSAR